MSLEKSQKIVKVLGILSIIGAVVTFLGALGMLGLGGVGIANLDSSNSELVQGTGIVLGLGIFLLVEGVLSLMEGIFSLQAAKDASKAQPLWIISILGVVVAAINVVGGIVNHSQDILTQICTLAINCFTFYLANNIKKNA